MKSLRLIVIAAVLVGLSSWMFFVRIGSHEHSAHMASTHQSCAVLMEAEKCAMGLGVHTALDQMVFPGVTTTWAVLTLLLVLVLLPTASTPKVVSGSATLRVPPNLRWRNSIFKLLDPILRLLRAGVIQRK